MKMKEAKPNRTLTILVFLIAILSALAAAVGIFSRGGPGLFQYESIRGRVIDIYGLGLYRHMSADVAVQGIGQDYVTLFLAVPVLLVAWWGYRKRSVRAHFVLSGTMGYFLVTYLFYTAMGMYNVMFLAYVALLGLSFFGLVLSLMAFEMERADLLFTERAPNRFSGGFLMFNALAIAFLWLGVVVPPLLDGTVYPAGLQHYTTLIVQGFDLGLLLPISFVVGYLLLRGRPAGYLFGTAYLVFLSLMMTALTAKIIAMGLQGQNIVPVVFIIPTFNAVTIGCAYLLVRNVRAGS